MTIDLNNDDLVPLADGPVATVLAGVHPDTGEAFALKIFPGTLDRRTRSTVDRDLSRLSSLPAHVPLLVAQAVETLADGRCALRMELCAQSLTELLESFGPLSVPDTLELGSALAAALAAAHGAGVVHGGVTPGNVLFRPSGEPVLSDAGTTLRQAFPRDPNINIEFLAPETLRDGTVDGRSDLYGLGTILFLALRGRAPHHGPPGEQPGARLLRVLSAPTPTLDRADLPPALGRLVSALLSKDPGTRPVDAATVAAQLDALMGADGSGTDPVPAPVPPRPQGDPILVFGPTPRPRRSVRVVRLLAATAVLSLLAAATLLLLDPSNDVTVSPAPTRVAVPSASPVPTRAVLLELIDPVDRGSAVELSWRSSEPLDFAVIVAAEGEQTRKVFIVHRNTSFGVPVDPVRRYCFAIQGADGTHVYESAPKPIRGASCSN